MFQIHLGHAQAQDDARDDNQLTIAVGAAAIPSYDGSDDTVVTPGAIVRGKVSGHSFFSRGTSLYFNLIKDKPSSSGLDVGFGPLTTVRLTRTRSIRDPQVKALGKLDPSVEIGGWGEIGKTGLFSGKYDSLSFRLTYAHDIAGAHDSYFIKPSLEYGTPITETTFLGVSLSVAQRTPSFALLGVLGQRVGYGYTVVWADTAQTVMKVRNVEPNSPVARAGLRRGDVVLAIAGRSPAQIAAGDPPAATQVGEPREFRIRDAKGNVVHKQKGDERIREQRRDAVDRCGIDAARAHALGLVNALVTEGSTLLDCAQALERLLARKVAMAAISVLLHGGGGDDATLEHIHRVGAGEDARLEDQGRLGELDRREGQAATDGVDLVGAQFGGLGAGGEGAGDPFTGGGFDVGGADAGCGYTGIGGHDGVLLRVEEWAGVVRRASRCSRSRVPDYADGRCSSTSCATGFA